MAIDYIETLVGLVFGVVSSQGFQVWGEGDYVFIWNTFCSWGAFHLKNLQLIVAAFLTVSPISAVADQIPGAEDPALRTAALAWLAADNPASEISALGAISSEGNIAARILTNKIFIRFGRLDFPNLSRAERRQLLPPAQDDRARSTLPYMVDKAFLPSTLANKRMRGGVTPEEWILGAQILVGAGLFDRLHTELRLVLFNRPEIDVEALLFLEKYVDDDDSIRSAIWVFRALEQKKIMHLEAFDPERARHHKERWKQSPWSSEQYAEFSQALIDGRWSAIRVLGLLSHFVSEAEFVFADIPDDAFMDWSELAFAIASAKQGETTDISGIDFGALGQLIANDAKRSAYLQPLLNSCESHCESEVSLCLAAGALSGVDRLHIGLSGFDPVISLDEYYGSERASRELTIMLGQNWRGLVMPQCYQEAAERLVELVNSPKD